MAILRFISIATAVLLGVTLSGCGGGGPQKLCCYQCGGGGAEEMKLHCQRASYDDDSDANPTCDLSDLDLGGDDASQCERSSNSYEHVGGNDSSTINAYGGAAASFWQDGNRESDRATAWTQAMDPSLQRSWGNNSNLSIKERVEQHKLALAERGIVVFKRGVPHHPLSVEVAGFFDFVNNVLNLIATAIQSVASLCSEGGVAEKCLAAVGLVVLADSKPNHVLRLPTAEEKLAMLSDEKLAMLPASSVFV